MDLTSAIIGAALLALCITPLIVMHYNKKRKEQRLTSALLELAELHSCSITQHDTWMNTAIGIDAGSNCLFFIRKIPHGEITRQTHLSGVSHVYREGEPDALSTDKLELVLVHTSSKEPDTVLEFYSREISLQINGEFEMIKKWEGIINDAIKK